MTLSATDAAVSSNNIVTAFRRVDNNVADLRTMILEFDDKQGWQAMGYDSFSVWSSKCLPWAKSRCYALLVEAGVASRIKGLLDGDIPSSHLSALSTVSVSQQAEVFGEAVKTANEGNEGEDWMPKAKHVAAAVSKWKASKAPEPPVEAPDAPESDPIATLIAEGGKPFDSLMGILSGLKTKIRELSETPSGALLAGELDDIERHRKNIYQLIRFSRPYAKCPYCHLYPASKCKACLGRKWVNETVAKQAPA